MEGMSQNSRHYISNISLFRINYRAQNMLIEMEQILFD